MVTMLAARAAWHSASNPEFASVPGATHPHLTIHLTGLVCTIVMALFSWKTSNLPMGSPEGHHEDRGTSRARGDGVSTS
jgi:hypothetical protein